MLAYDVTVQPASQLYTGLSVLTQLDGLILKMQRHNYTVNHKAREGRERRGMDWERVGRRKGKEWCGQWRSQRESRGMAPNSKHQMCSFKLKMHQKCFRLGLRPGLRGEAYRTLPRLRSRLGRGTPLPIPLPSDAFGFSISEPSAPRFLAPNTNSWLRHWVRVGKGRGRSGAGIEGDLYRIGKIKGGNPT